MDRAYLDNFCFLVRFARSLGVRREADCEDLAQEVFANAWEQLDTYDPARGTMRAWLASIALHKARRWRKLSQNRLEHTAEALEEQRIPERDPEQRTATVQIETLTRELLDQLEEDQRIALVLIDLHDFTMQEAADAQGVPLGTVRTRLYKARSELQKKIERLRRQRKVTLDDVRGVALPVPSEVTRDAGEEGTAAAAAVAARVVVRGTALAGGAKIAGAVMALVASAAGGAALHAAMDGEPVPAAVVAIEAPPAPAASVAAPARSASATIAPAASSAEGPASAPADAPADAPAAARTSTARASYDSEADLIQRMRAAVGNRPAEVVVLAEKHARAYPSKNAQEREALLILALARTGRHAEARARAEKFRATYPRSAYLGIIDVETGGLKR